MGHLLRLVFVIYIIKCNVAGTTSNEDMGMGSGDSMPLGDPNPTYFASSVDSTESHTSSVTLPSMFSMSSSLVVFSSNQDQNLTPTPTTSTIPSITTASTASTIPRLTTASTSQTTNFSALPTVIATTSTIDIIVTSVIPTPTTRRVPIPTTTDNEGPGTDAPTTVEKSTSGTSPEGLAAAVAVTAVVLVILIIILCGLICCYHMFKNNAKTHKKIIEFALQEVNGDHDKLLTQDVLYGHINASRMATIPAEKLPSYVIDLHRDNCFNAEEEYESVKEMDPEFSKHAASQDCNEVKNRYINILPRDETRVVLSTVPKVHGSDYINANYVDGYNHENEYIASQGPLPNTTIDFWRMIWEQNVHIIVMVTNPVENGMVKCHEYWPERGVGQFGNMVVTTVGEKLFPEFIVRQFTLTMNSKNRKMSQVCIVREITQYHFTDWPDFGVPEDASSMLKFVRRVRRATSPTHGPVVIHCSAGVGRTGTFIAIDVMLQKMAAKESLNVQEFVCRMRAQRAFMIQTSAQYLFVYDALLHAFIHGCTEIRASLLGTHLSSLDKPASSGGSGVTTVLEQEFKHVLLMRFPADHFFSVAMEECNAAKNRSIENLPLDDNRVILEDVNKVAGEDYINASFINGYYNRVEFIATQHPVATTRGDLWRMIVERDVNTLVVIGALEDESDCYWPDDGKQEYDGGITVELKDTQEFAESKITKRIFDVSMEQGDSCVTVVQFQLHGWPREGVPSSPDMMLDLVHLSRQHWRETGFNLITVHTATNVESELSGVYCGICILLRQLEVEGCADLVTTAQKLRQKRPAIITNKDYYRFMYEVLVATL